MNAINAAENEIERLQKVVAEQISEIELYKDTARTFSERIAALEAEIERLKNERARPGSLA